jgi:hypothetical protein
MGSEEKRWEDSRGTKGRDAYLSAGHTVRLVDGQITKEGETGKSKSSVIYSLPVPSKSCLNDRASAPFLRFELAPPSIQR